MVKAYTFSQNTFFLMMAYVIEKAFVFFYFIFLARYLGPDNFGVYNSALSFVTIFSVLIDFGFATVLIREGAKDRSRAQAYLENALTVKLFASFATFLLIFLIVKLLNYSITSQWLIYLFAIWIIIESLAATFFGFFRSQHNLRYEAKAFIVNKVFYVVLGLIFIFLKFPLVTFTLPMILGSLLYLFFPIIISRRFFSLKLKFDQSITKHFFKIAFPIVFSIIFSTAFFSINTVLISSLDSDRAAGFFSAAFRIPMALLFLAGAIGASIFPVFSSLVKENKERLSLIFQRVVFYMILLAIPLMFGGWIMGDQIIVFTYGQDFLEAVSSFRIIISISIFLFLDFVFSSLLTAIDKQKANALSRGLGLLINIILCFILIPISGQLGGAIAFTVGFVIFSLIQIILISKAVVTNLRYLIKKFLLVVLSCLVMSLCLLIFKNYFHLLLSLSLATVVYGLSLYLSGGIKKEDIVEIKYLVNSTLRRKSSDKIQEEAPPINEI